MQFTSSRTRFALFTSVLYNMRRDLLVNGAHEQRPPLFYNALKAEASCHWGTWGTCSSPDSMATLVNGLRNQVNSITPCI